jgi:hypothetical protein
MELRDACAVYPIALSILVYPLCYRMSGRQKPRGHERGKGATNKMSHAIGIADKPVLSLME